MAERERRPSRPGGAEAPNEHCRHAGAHAETRNRTFSLNSPEFYEAVTEPPDPWLWGPCLPREPRGRDLPLVRE